MVVYVFLLTDINRAIELLDKLQRTGEVPPQKLQALQRVLQSEFCNAVREVRHFVILKTFYWAGFSLLFSPMLNLNIQNVTVVWILLVHLIKYK